MNGPEHYEAAERLLAQSNKALGEVADFYMTQAQVHATLALVAVTAESTQSQMFTMKPEWASTLRPDVRE